MYIYDVSKDTKALKDASTPVYQGVGKNISKYAIRSKYNTL